MRLGASASPRVPGRRPTQAGDGDPGACPIDVNLCFTQKMRGQRCNSSAAGKIPALAIALCRAGGEQVLASAARPESGELNGHGPAPKQGDSKNHTLPGLTRSANQIL